MALGLPAGGWPAVHPHGAGGGLIRPAQSRQLRQRLHLVGWGVRAQERGRQCLCAAAGGVLRNRIHLLGQGVRTQGREGHQCLQPAQSGILRYRLRVLGADVCAQVMGGVFNRRGGRCAGSIDDSVVDFFDLFAAHGLHHEDWHDGAVKDLPDDTDVDHSQIVVLRIDTNRLRH